MNIGTHWLLAGFCANSVDAGIANTVAACIGATIPDIDSQRSVIGRLFWFISKPVEDEFGHRGFIHTLPLWTLILGLSVWISSYFDNSLIIWIATGGISHIIADCYNVSGVRLFTPFTERRFVFFKMEWRIYVNSIQEILFSTCVIGLIFLSVYAHSIGGWRKLINLFAHSPRISTEELGRASNLRCNIKGLFRHGNGNQEKVEWLCVGLEGKGIALWDGRQIIRNGGDGHFLESTLKQSEQTWPVIIVKGFVTSDIPCFWFSGKSWHFARPGDLMHGSIKSVSGEMPVIIPYEITERGWDD